MLRECGEHGYYRGETCPICGEPGKFLMNEQELEQLGRTLAGVLRHFPERFGLDMDEQGFVNIRDFINALRDNNRRYHWLRPHHLIAIIETDPKGRYQISNDLMRATYGHSLELELKLPTENIPDHLYYPATPEEADIILETGLRPSDRKMVHLSKTYQDAVNAGKVRVEFPIILEIDATKAIEAGNVLTHEIPPEFLSKKEEEEEI
jgi:putative RNA 2'-phosphotransferase